MFKPKRVLFFFSTFLLLIFIPLLFAEETVTITTYYPSPYGVYSSLQVDKLGVGDNSGDNILNSADVPTTSGDAWIKGKVGIGTINPQTKLDVAGGVKMGNEPTCNASTEGTQRYNSGSKQMEFCNGTAWTAIGGGAYACYQGTFGYGTPSAFTSACSTPGCAPVIGLGTYSNNLFSGIINPGGTFGYHSCGSDAACAATYGRGQNYLWYGSYGGSGWIINTYAVGVANLPAQLSLCQ